MREHVRIEPTKWSAPAPVRLRWARLREPQLVDLLASPVVVPYHWVDKSSTLCPREECPLCLAGHPALVRGYGPALAALCTDSGLQQRPWSCCVWELTCEQLLCWEAAASAFGVVVVSRQSRDNGPVKVRTPEYRPSRHAEAAAWDIEPTILSVFGPSGLTAYRRAQQ